MRNKFHITTIINPFNRSLQGHIYIIYTILHLNIFSILAEFAVLNDDGKVSASQTWCQLYHTFLFHRHSSVLIFFIIFYNMYLIIFYIPLLQPDLYEIFEQLISLQTNQEAKVKFNWHYCYDFVTPLLL